MAGKVKHGHSTRTGRTPTLYSYQGMLGRCYNANHVHYDRYGGRGITVCDRWRGQGGFIRFLEDMKERPAKEFTLERKDNQLGYSKDNCKWASLEEQSRNRDCSRMVTVDGERMCFTAALDKFDKRSDFFTILGRLRRGWDTKAALTKPIDRKRGRNLGSGKWRKKACQQPDAAGADTNAIAPFSHGKRDGKVPERCDLLNNESKPSPVLLKTLQRQSRR